jgi:peroxisomal 3,2-trans-enoyl-CoA isomerase
MAAPSTSIFEVDYRGRVAVVTINNEKKLNAMTGPQYYELAQIMRDIATHDEVYITFLTGKGRYFSA